MNFRAEAVVINLMPKSNLPTGTASLVSRRQFIKYSTLATGVVFGTAPAFLRGQHLNERLNIAVIGAGGKGKLDVIEDTEPHG